MKCKYSNQYSVQIYVAAFTCFLSGLVALGQVAYGAWLIHYIPKLIGLLGRIMFNLSVAFTGLGGYGSVLALFGIIALVLRRRRLIILHIFLVILSILSMCVVWAMVYLEQRKISTELPGRLLEKESKQYYNIINHEYNCNLTETQTNGEFQKCSDFLSRQTWILAYAILGLNGVFICVQSVLVLMEVIISRLLKQSIRTYPVGHRNPLATDLTHTNPSTLMTPEDVSSTSEGTSLEMSHVEPSAPSRPPSSPSLTGLPPIPFNPAVSPPFPTQIGFSFSSNNPKTLPNQGRFQRHPSITQL